MTHKDDVLLDKSRREFALDKALLYIITFKRNPHPEEAVEAAEIFYKFLKGA